MKFIDVMKLWTLTTILTAINQIKVVNSKIFDKYFKANAKPVMGNTATLKIRKGAGVVLESILPGAERLLKDLKDVYEITIKLPRFGLQDTILPHEINEFESLEGVAKAEAVSQKITTILQDHKDDYMTTLEFTVFIWLIAVKIVFNVHNFITSRNFIFSPILELFYL